jgi:hypothetical protein
MTQHKAMTLDEKLTILNKSVALKKAGDLEGADRLVKSVPLPPYIAKVMKEKVGMEFFTRYNWNLSEAELEFGPDWLSR